MNKNDRTISFTEAEGSSSIAQLSGTACRKMLALLDHLELSIFLLYCLAGVKERNTRALDSFCIQRPWCSSQSD